ncbi:ABC transporter ATP-binding protein [Paracoccus sp. Z330]|uniref:ABC transporter ATP-binding protein n=1 Tax=Paracoccus onchidii TaxID=3017813 RepID=A0ABT4ZGF8_9RHOB|nr:ABC transporter ATP-binding protein [Paracoccus onchidii]MDB6178454.1 ABC transporter ATP-binding protein [Paracoccus onchidii]
MSLLEVTDLAVAAGSLQLVDGVTLDVRPGEVVALVGESGSGKSLTALSVIGLLADSLRITRGSIRFDGVPVHGAGGQDMADLRGNGLAMIFQEPVSSLNPLMPIGAQVAESLIVHGRASPADAAQQAVRMLGRVGIPDPERRAHQLPAELSGGMCQRVMIAAALISRPRLLIADEPTTALDVTIQAQILDLIRDLAEEEGTAVLMITHDMGIVAEMADRVCVMYGGRVVEQGDVHDIFRQPRHPYTAMLLRTIPRLDHPPKQELFAIPGNVPSPRNWPQGCRFKTRCDRATAQCDATPALSEGAHRVACFHPLSEGMS